MKNNEKNIDDVKDSVDIGGWTKISADRLDIVRNILLVAASDIGKIRKEFEEDIRQKVAPPSSRISKFPSWKDRVILEYVRAGQVLGLWEFDQSSRLKFENRFENQILTIINENNTGEKLSSAEGKAFASILLEHPHVSEFLSWFMIDNRRPISVENFLNNSTSIALTEVTPKASRPKGPDTYIKDNMRFPIDKPYIRITWVNIAWCKAVGLIDEVKVIPKGICPKDESHKVYPIKIDGSHGKELSIERLLSLILEKYGVRKDEVKRITIPKLIYDMCVTYFISINYFKERVIKAYEMFSNEFYLEQISSVFVDSKTRRFNLEKNYIRVGGFYRGYLAIHGGLGGKVNE